MERERVSGLTKKQLNNFPEMVWKQTHNKLNFGEKCSCCLEEYKIDDNLRVVSCFHRFHVGCIDQWFSKNSTCPLCKKDYKEIEEVLPN